MIVIKPKTKNISLYLNPEFVDVLDGNRQNYSRSSFIEHVLLEKFGK